jgi:hypothetical protein
LYFAWQESCQCLYVFDCALHQIPAYVAFLVVQLHRWPLYLHMLLYEKCSPIFFNRFFKYRKQALWRNTGMFVFGLQLGVCPQHSRLSLRCVPGVLGTSHHSQNNRRSCIQSKHIWNILLFWNIDRVWTRYEISGLPPYFSFRSQLLFGLSQNKTKRALFQF